MKISKSQLQQIIKEEMEAELSEDKYATETTPAENRSLFDECRRRKKHPEWLTGYIAFLDQTVR